MKFPEEDLLLLFDGNYETNKPYKVVFEDELFIDANYDGSFSKKRIVFTHIKHPNKIFQTTIFRSGSPSDPYFWAKDDGECPEVERFEKVIVDWKEKN